MVNEPYGHPVLSERLLFCKHTPHLMSELDQRVAIRLFSLKGPRPSQIQAELSDVYHEQAFQLAAAEK
jgi:hypothetical protein